VSCWQGSDGQARQPRRLPWRTITAPRLLADETAFVHCRTTVVEAFPHAVGMWSGGRKSSIRITDACQSVRLGSAEISQVIFLFRRAGPVEVRRLERQQVLHHLLPHHRHGGASAGDAMATLLRLASVVDAWTLSYEDHRGLGPAVVEVCEAGM